MQKLNGREIYAAVLVMFITVILVFMQVREVLSVYSDAVRTDAGSVIVNKKEILDTIQNLMLILFGALGSILLLRKKLAGWIFSIPILCFYFSIAVYGLITAGKISFDLSFILVLIAALILLTAIVFLFLTSTLQKFRVSKKVILPTLLLFMALLAITFLL